jgi:sulfate transport system ATP-binding protein
MAFDCPNYAGEQERDATVYMRPHELYIKRSRNGAPSLEARVTRVNPAGSVAKVRLETVEGNPLQVDLSLEEFDELHLTPGETVHVYPKYARVFVPEYAI